MGRDLKFVVIDSEENSRNIILMLDKELNIIQINPVAEKSFNYKSEEVQGSNVSFLNLNMEDIEAMKHAKPVINTNLNTGVNYVSIDGETGLTVEPKDVEQLAYAINKLLHNALLRTNLGINAQRRTKQTFNIFNNLNYHNTLSII